MNETKGTGQHQAQTSGVGPKEHLREQIEKSIKQKHNDCEYEHEPYSMVAECLLENPNDPAEDAEVGDGIADQDGPQKIFRILQKVMEHFGRASAGAHVLPDAQSAERKDARLHARKQ